MNYNINDSHTVSFNEYAKFARLFPIFAEKMELVGFNAVKLGYNQRMKFLCDIETAYRGIYRFGDGLLSEMTKGTGDKTNQRYFLNALDNDNFIKIAEGKAHDFFITSPPLGDRYGGNAEMIAYFTDKALNTAVKMGAKFWPMKEACIIVKQYCHCADVAMGTMENREIHSMTDTLLNRIGMDDHPWFADFCYIWCESAKPRTEIVITSRESAPIYDDFVSQIHELKPETKQRYNAANNKKARMARNIKQVGDIIGEVDSFTVEYGIFHKDTCRQLCHLAKALKEIITDLREPFVSSKKHEYSRIYTQDTEVGKRGRSKRSGTCETVDDLYFLADSCANYESQIMTLTINTMTPYTTVTRRGKKLCEEQETVLALSLPSSNSPLSYDRSDDLSVTIRRKMLDYNPLRPDSDNLNINFLRPLRQRVKIIYVKTDKKGWIGEHDCEIKISPKSSDFYL